MSEDIYIHGDDISTSVDFEDGEAGTVSFTFKAIERYKASEIKAIVEAFMHAPGTKPWRLVRRLDLLSQSACELFAREAGRPAKSKDFHVGIALSVAIERVVKYLDSRDESIWLDEADPRTDARWLLEPLILDAAPNVLFGKGGAGKTYLSMRLAMSIASGLPFQGIAPTRITNVLFLDYEDEASNLVDRLWRLAGSKVTEFQPKIDDLKNKIRYVRPKGVPLHDYSDTVQKLVKAHNIGLVIVDSAALACGGEPERAESAIRYFNALSKIPAATLTIAHETKAENHDYVFGSVFFHNSARNIWNAQVNHESDDGRIVQVGLFHRKCNHGPLRRPVPVRVFHGDGFVDMGRGDLTLWEQEMRLPDRIMARLREHGWSQGDLAQELGTENKRIGETLKRLQSRGKAKEEGANFWVKGDTEKTG